MPPMRHPRGTRPKAAKARDPRDRISSLMEAKPRRDSAVRVGTTGRGPRLGASALEAGGMSRIVPPVLTVPCCRLAIGAARWWPRGKPRPDWCTAHGR